MQNSSNSSLVLHSRDRQFGVRLVEQTGLPEGLLFVQNGQEMIVQLTVTAELVTEGEEQPRPQQGIEYINTVQLPNFRRVETAPVYCLEGARETYSVTTVAGNWQVVWHYTFCARHPRFALSFTVTPLAGAREEGSQATLRDVRLSATFQPASLASWYIEAPGNQLRPRVRADWLHLPVGVNSVGNVAGSTGLVAFHQPVDHQVLILWPFSRTEIGDLWLQRRGEALQFTIATGLAGRLFPGEELLYETVFFDALSGTWEEVRDTIPRWYDSPGLHTPIDRPDWMKTASIFEVQIGSSVFWGGYSYAPYPTVRHLLDDLPRIKDLGYTMLQIMPRQPYPSYNVHDYADITTSYGDENDLRELVANCHALGMRVILDILMHGVIDQEIMAETAGKVRSGPYFTRLDEETNIFSPNPDAYAIAWCRHILDFEPHWSAGSPSSHPLVAEHPEWFMRDSQQKIIGIYTKAFDAANPAWQEYFMQAAESLVHRLDIDGFRFDAPTYNDLPNWSKATEKRASYSPLGCLELFEQLRPRLKALKEDIMLYTEPSGALFRQAMDITYNYDEQWLIPDTLGPDGADDEVRRPLRVRTGRNLAAWFHERNAVLPPGSLIAHHIDSHDTFWWPLPGTKWRREQVGLPATRALLAIFALSGGVYMTFIGGEEGIEQEVRTVHRLRATLPEIGLGAARYDVLEVEQEDVYTVARQQGENCSLLLVNLSAQPCVTACTFDAGRCGLSAGSYHLTDAWNTGEGEGKIWQARSLDLGQHPVTFSLEFAPFQVYLLVVRRAA